MDENSIALSIKPLMQVAAVMNVKGFLNIVADVLDETQHEDMARMLRVIVEGPHESNQSN
jgi:hypothetical protein